MSDKSKAAGRTGRQRRTESTTDGLPWGKKNLLLMAGAAVSIVAGYALLGQGSITAAPMLLVLGYVVLIPLAIIL